MTKLFTHTEEIEHCGECCEVLDWFDTGKGGHRCGLRKCGTGWRIIKDLWGKIPSWCPLPEKEND